MLLPNFSQEDVTKDNGYSDIAQLDRTQDSVMHHITPQNFLESIDEYKTCHEHWERNAIMEQHIKNT